MGYVATMYYVYVLKNEQGRHYIGSASDIKSRLRQHNQNCVTSTKNRGPYSLAYQEQFINKTAARKRENELKSFKGNGVFKSLLEVKHDPVV